MIKKTLQDAAERLSKNYKEQELFEVHAKAKLPKRKEIIDILDEVRRLMFPGYFGTENIALVNLEHFAGNTLAVVSEKLFKQIKVALMFSGVCTDVNDAQKKAEELSIKFIEELPKIQSLVIKDVEAVLQGDPAAGSLEEIIFSYPGIFAISVYRIAHILYELNVPLIPRIMTEHAHGKTGIDINPGAKIGEYFFIDHGTGIVIGETTEIGNHVKIYQGVTLGALSTMKGQALSGVKRHPTIEDYVVIYANTTVLGGETVIGEGSVIAGNTFLTESVPANTTVSAYMPKLNIKERKKSTKKLVENGNE